MLGLATMGLLSMGALSECSSDAESRRELGSEFLLAHPQYTPRWSGDGTLIVFGHGNRIYLVDSIGSLIRSIPEETHSGEWYAVDYSPDISSDGSQVVYTTLRHKEGFGWGAARSFELATYSVEDSEQRRLTKNKSVDTNAAWSPDGNLIAFVSRRALHTMKADGSDMQSIGAVDFAVPSSPPQWSPDGSRIAFAGGDETGNPIYLYTVRADGSELMRFGEAQEQLVRWSPDGSQLALAKVEDGKVKIDLVNAGGSASRQLVQFTPEDLAPEGMTSMSWSPDGSEILFVPSFGGYEERYSMISVVGLDGSQVRHLTDRISRSYASWSPDGSRIVVHIHPKPSFLARLPEGVVLYTMAPDGSDMRTLVWGGSGRLVAENSRWQEEVTGDIAACSQGFVVPDPKRNPGLVEDCETLLSIRDILAGEGVVLGWSAEVPMGEWPGVEIDGDQDRVYSLRLNEFMPDIPKLDGTIPPALGNLAGLEYLVIIGARLSGSIPPELGNLSNLKELLLGSALTGTIPAELGKLTNLTSLRLMENRLTGTIPPELGKLTNLNSLRLDMNRLWGSIPPELGNLTNLESLSLDRNQLGGSIPLELGSLTNLRILHLDGNALTGCIPAPLASKPYLSLRTDGLEPC